MKHYITLADDDFFITYKEYYDKLMKLGIQWEADISNYTFVFASEADRTLAKLTVFNNSKFKEFKRTEYNLRSIK